MSGQTRLNCHTCRPSSMDILGVIRKEFFPVHVSNRIVAASGTSPVQYIYRRLFSVAAKELTIDVRAASLRCKSARLQTLAHFTADARQTLPKQPGTGHQVCLHVIRLCYLAGINIRVDASQRLEVPG